ncbi:MAG: hypothetical protein ACREU9_14085, partial [Gammaproteobacteria bacterium]
MPDDLKGYRVFIASPSGLSEDPRAYANSGSYCKAFGLNLKERSSGQHKGQIKITKRGSGPAR